MDGDVGNETQPQRILRPDLEFDPRDVNAKNVSGSTAGSGSGDFHVYRQERRRELTRIQNLEVEAKRKAEQEQQSKEASTRRAKEDSRSLSRSSKRKRKKERALAAAKSYKKRREDSEPVDREAVESSELVAVGQSESNEATIDEAEDAHESGQDGGGGKD